MMQINQRARARTHTQKQSYMDVYVNYKVQSIKNTPALHITFHKKT